MHAQEVRSFAPTDGPTTTRRPPANASNMAASAIRSLHLTPRAASSISVAPAREHAEHDGRGAVHAAVEPAIKKDKAATKKLKAAIKLHEAARQRQAEHQADAPLPVQVRWSAE